MAQNRRLVYDPLYDPIAEARLQRNIDPTLNPRSKSTIHRTITDLGDIAEGQFYQFGVNTGDPKAYPANHLFMNGFRISSILIPEKSGIRSFDLATGKILATLDTKDRYGDYSQEIDMVTDEGVITFVIKARIVDAGVLKATTAQKKTDLQ